MKNYMYIIISLIPLYIQPSSRNQNPSPSKRKNPPVEYQLTTPVLKAAYTGEMAYWHPDQIQEAFQQGPNQFGSSILFVARDDKTAHTILNALTTEQRQMLLMHTNHNNQNVFHQHSCRHCPELLNMLAQSAQQLGILHILLRTKDKPHGDTPLHKATSQLQAENVRVLSFWQAPSKMFNADFRNRETAEMIAMRLNWLTEYKQAWTTGQEQKKEEEILQRHYTKERLSAIVQIIQNSLGDNAENFEIQQK